MNSRAFFIFMALMGNKKLKIFILEEIPVSQVIIAHKNEKGEVEYFSTIAREIKEASPQPSPKERE